MVPTALHINLLYIFVYIYIFFYLKRLETQLTAAIADKSAARGKEYGIWN